MSGLCTASENLVSNPGFDKDVNADGIPDDWRHNSQKEAAVFKWDTTEKDTGGHAVMIDRVRGMKGCARWYQMIPVKAGVKYQISCSYKTGDNFLPKADIMIHGCGVNYKSEWILRSSSEAAGGWKSIRFDFMPKQSGKIGLYLQHRGKGKIWYDNIRITKAAKSDNLLPNPGFEEVKVNGMPGGGWWLFPAWVVRRKFAGNLSVNKVTFHSGNNSLELRVMRPTRRIGIISPYQQVSPGDKLYISAFCRGQTDSPEKQILQIVINYRNNQGIGTKSDVVKGQITGQWKKYEGVFTVPANTCCAELGIIIPAGFTGKLWVDDTVLKKLNNYTLSLLSPRTKQKIGLRKLKYLLQNDNKNRDELQLDLTVDNKPATSKKFTTIGKNRETGELVFKVEFPGKHKVKLILRDVKNNRELFALEKDIVVEAKLVSNPVLPTYAWPGEKSVRGSMKINLPQLQLETATVTVTMEKTGKPVNKQEFHPTPAKLNYSFPIDKLEAGDYLIKVRLFDKNRKEIASRTEVFHVMNSPRPDVKIKDGILLVNNRPFFPIGMFHAPINQEYVQAGFNVIHNYEFEGHWDNEKHVFPIRKVIATLDKAKKLGLWGIIGTPRFRFHRGDWQYLRDRFTTLKNHPTVLCYEEEENMARGILTLRKIKQWYSFIKDIDPERPVLLGDTNQSSNLTGNDEANHGWLFPDAVTDMGIWWWYPFPLKKGQTEIIPPAWLTRNASETGKPIWVGLQADTLFVTGDKKFADCHPNDKEYRCQAYLAIVSGAKGILYFSRRVLKLPSRWTALKKLVTELKDMSPVFLSPTSQLSVSVIGGDKISLLLKKHGDVYYLLAVNRDKPFAEVTFTFPFKASKVKVRYENRELQIKNQKLKDTFSPYEVHVYEITPKKRNGKNR